MAPISLGELLENSLEFLETLQRALKSERETTGSERVRLLTAALSQQQQALIETVERIQDRQSARTLARRLAYDGALDAAPPPPVPSDSRTLTAWLVGATKALAERFGALSTQRRLGPAADAVGEIERLLVAYCKRVAVECQRFEDL